MDIFNVRDYVAVILVALAAGLAFARRGDQGLLMPARQATLDRLFGPSGIMRGRKASRNFWPDDDDSDAAADQMIEEMKEPAAPPEALGRHHRRELEPIRVTFPCLEPSAARPYPDDQRPPWELPAGFRPRVVSPVPDVLLTGPHAWLPGSSQDPPGPVREVQSAIRGDLGHYLEGMPGYGED